MWSWEPGCLHQDNGILFNLIDYQDSHATYRVSGDRYQSWFPVKSITMVIESLIFWKASEVHFSGSIGVQELSCHAPVSLRA